MNKMNDTGRQGSNRRPLRVSRIFSAPRETVFKAWSSADHVKRWFCPNGYSVPEAAVEMRVGGAVRGLHALAGRRRSIGPRGHSPRSWRRNA